eukprot:7303036-Alexandrium_andersonii.AAC.1
MPPRQKQDRPGQSGERSSASAAVASTAKQGRQQARVSAHPPMRKRSAHAVRLAAPTRASAHAMRT